MKVIVAGLPKTGTKSMAAALQELGMNVYDMLEHFEYLHDDWMNICKRGGRTDDFRRMYEGVDAVTDIPTCYFWEELLKAFPEAKVILTVRDEEESCMESTKKQIESFHSPIMKVMQIFSPTFRKFLHFAYVVEFNALLKSTFRNTFKLRRHSNFDAKKCFD